jgi:hypothetical protein
MTINGLSCKYLEKKGKKAELEIEGQKIVISADYLPTDINPGQEIHLRFFSSNGSDEEAKRLAKAILEEIFKK